MRFNILFLSTIYSFPIFAQTKIYLSPAVGAQFPFSYVIDKQLADKYFKVNTFDFEPSFDISLRAEINHNWIFFAGWQAGNTGFSYKYSDRYTYNFEGAVSNGLYTSRVPIGVNKDLCVIRIGKIKKRAELLDKMSNNSLSHNFTYLILFRLQALGGISFDKIAPSTYENQWTDFFYGRQYFTINHRQNISCFVGFTLQFFNYDKDLFNISFYYSQGLRQAVGANIEYSLNGDNYFATIGSNGSLLAIQLAYPIKLFMIKGR